ncbi:thioredoxin family protein [Acholeplasma granularum]|uniref:thioredoxin family protein n=1 Tax=Acholeplasma granularum TaxID=264635 RepID=UPI0004AD8BF2|nr:thioredoxin family protein [Acholeplasma granularum]
MLFELTNKNFDEFVINSSNYVLVEFFSPTCMSCLSLETLLEDISDDYYGKLKVYKADAEKLEDLADKYDIFSLPTMLLFKDGKLLRELQGLHKIEKIEEWLDL